LFDQLIADFPTTARFCDSLAWLLANGPADELRDLSRAATLAARATALVPDNKFFWRTKGTVQFRLRDWTAARATLGKADQLGPPEAGITVCVQAMIESQLGNHAAAQNLLEEARSWSNVNQPGDDELQRFHDEAATLMSKQADE